MQKKLKAFDDSNRTDKLYSLIRPHIRDGMSFLDIGCGFSHLPEMQGTCLPQRIHNDFPNVHYLGIDRCKKIIEKNQDAYPLYSWICEEVAEVNLATSFDFIIHVGFDKAKYSNAWRVHLKLLEEGHRPQLVLLESGCRPLDTHSEHLESYYTASSFYYSAGYEMKDTGEYIWTAPVTQPRRFYRIFEEGKNIE